MRRYSWLIFANFHGAATQTQIFVGQFPSNTSNFPLFEHQRRTSKAMSALGSLRIHLAASIHSRSGSGHFLGHPVEEAMPRLSRRKVVARVRRRIYKWLLSKSVDCDDFGSESESSATASKKAIAAEFERTNQLATERAIRSTSITSIFHREEQQHRCRSAAPSTSINSVASADQDAQRELEDLARLRADVLSYLNSPYGRESDPDGYVTQQQHSLHEIRDGKDKQTYLSDVRHRLVKIESLPQVEQNRIYELLLYKATIEEVKEQYELHCRRLEEVRNNAPQIVEGQKMREMLEDRAPDEYRNTGSQPEEESSQEAAGRTPKAHNEAHYWEDEGLCKRTALKGLIRLLERCEAILKRANQDFIPNAWRSSHLMLTKRWADGKRGWTGLDQDM